eukprot:CAMPEP_0119320628 /NCGR_PEP_ID=MMETSP1333-20130426/52974_1 /TAXON_ID=418940 /ORGANISM="Scyphosphaera apsteinii, Strain RCC1455" /LENGTH=138 /DNA_ID=CAMNT_0007327389 /DNA_START=29 /DNA_END=445 /DNA_ORIENTATION=+
MTLGRTMVQVDSMRWNERMKQERRVYRGFSHPRTEEQLQEMSRPWAFTPPEQLRLPTERIMTCSYPALDVTAGTNRLTPHAARSGQHIFGTWDLSVRSVSKWPAAEGWGTRHVQNRTSRVKLPALGFDLPVYNRPAEN